MTSPLHLPLKLPCISVAPLMQLLRISRAPLSPIPSIGVAPPFAGDAIQRLGSFVAKFTRGDSDPERFLAPEIFTSQSSIAPRKELAIKTQICSLYQ